MSTSSIAASRFLSEKGWRTLIRNIRAGQVVPVIGPELIQVEDDEDGAAKSLNCFLASRLARQLALDSRQFESINDVASAHLLAGGKRKDVYDEVRELLDGTTSPVNEALLELARITDFSVFVCGTFDHQLSKALKDVRSEYRWDRDCFSYHPSSPVDLPSEGSIGNPLPQNPFCQRQLASGFRTKQRKQNHVPYRLCVGQ